MSNYYIDANDIPSYLSELKLITSESNVKMFVFNVIANIYCYASYIYIYKKKDKIKCTLSSMCVL